MSVASLLELFRSLPPSDSVLIVTHTNADPDAVATALVVREVLSQLGLKAATCFPEGISRASRELLEKLGISYENSCTCRGRHVVVCDASNEAVLGEAAQCLAGAASLVIIDHHEAGSLSGRARVAVIEPDEPAATTLAVELAQAAGVRLSPQLASLALGGILYDTKRFAVVSPRTLRAAAWLLECGGRYESALPRSEEELDYSEKVARLKAAQRALFVEVCGHIIALSEVTAYEASAARALVSLGADVAFVVGGKEEVRVSARASRKVLDKGVDLAEILRRVAEAVGGQGGGHKGAAGLNVRGGVTPGTVLRKLAEEVTRVLSEHCSGAA